MAIDLETAFKKVRDAREAAELERADKNYKKNEKIQECADACARLFGGHNRVAVRRQGDSVVLDAKNDGWMTLDFSDDSNFTTKIGKKPLTSMPREEHPSGGSYTGDAMIGEAIANWYMDLPKRD